MVLDQGTLLFSSFLRTTRHLLHPNQHISFLFLPLTAKPTELPPSTATSIQPSEPFQLNNKTDIHIKADPGHHAKQWNHVDPGLRPTSSIQAGEWAGGDAEEKGQEGRADL